MAVRDESLTRGNSVIVMGKTGKADGNSCWLQVIPRAVVVRGSVPISIIRTVPVSGLEEELKPDIWREIGITAWNRVDGRRCRYNDCRRQWKPYSDMKIYITT